MTRKLTASVLLCAVLVASTFAHDLFLKLDDYFVAVNQKISIKILNGSFQSSEGAVSFKRLKDVSVVSPAGAVTHPQETDFTDDGMTALLNLQPAEAGSYVVGLYTMTREITLPGKEFNEYLIEDGMPDTLAERKRTNTLDKLARERYSKHVKTIFQVGNKQTANFKTVLGYPVEIVPRNNPYLLKTGGTFEFLCLKDGKPIVNQFVMSGREAAGKLITGANVRTDKKGIAKVKLNGKGKWYVKFIQMTKLSKPELDYESKWASLSFEIR